MQKAVQYTPPSSSEPNEAGTVSLCELPVPTKPRRGHALVSISHAGVCGTDLHVLSGRGTGSLITGQEPRVLGHEASGHVIQLADDEDESAKQSIKIGELMVLQPVGQCGSCRQCRDGRYNQCDEYFSSFIGLNVNGTWQSVLEVPLDRIHPVDRYSGGQSPPADWAALAEPLSCVLNGLNRLGHLPGTSRALVAGAGIIGLLACIALRRRGVARVTVSEPNAQRRRLVEGLGRAISGLTACSPEEVAKLKPFDVVVECSGSPAAGSLACEVAGNSGRILLLGIGNVDSQLTLEPLAAFFKELTVLSACASRYTLPEAIGLLGELSCIDGLSLELLGIKKLPIEEFSKGLQLMRDGQASKVLLQPQRA
ncbi:hypothetical protein BOX15_Mlig018979g3 [Macrostomum lignano]|uniref:PKS_ER domain-containing protein n=2 Tax=Macrostomum lignano TaxID=282301 RepID=A0A267ER92_9PLAT|nr:hypothetical protein BOX15_Mlig018979g3 [Macrostomum lignano]